MVPSLYRQFTLIRLFIKITGLCREAEKDAIWRRSEHMHTKTKLPDGWSERNKSITVNLSDI